MQNVLVLVRMAPGLPLFPMRLTYTLYDRLLWVVLAAGLSVPNACKTTAEKSLCVSGGGKCVVMSDGYYPVAAACIVLGCAGMDLAI